MKKRTRPAALLLLVSFLLFTLTACGQTDPLRQVSAVQDDETVAVLETTMGSITLRLFDQIAPLAVENFVTLATEGAYNGTPFSRVVDEYMIQSGDYNGLGGGSIWGSGFADEFSMELWHFRGALSMVNTGPDSNGSQFFIVQAGTLDEHVKNELLEEPDYPKEVVNQYVQGGGGAPWLDGKNTVFGYVIEGMDVVDAIAGVHTDENFKPIEDVTILSVTITTYGALQQV